MAPSAGSARVSPIDGPAYRWRLTRSWRFGAGRLCWVLLNPSTADEHADDPTIRRVVRFSQDHGARALIVVNLFAVRATHPAELRPLVEAGVDIVGPRNRDALEAAIGASDSVVFAWGATAGMRGLERLLAAQTAVVRRTCVRRDTPVRCLGLTATGAPRHPLYVPAVTPLQPWRASP